MKTYAHQASKRRTLMGLTALGTNFAIGASTLVETCTEPDQGRPLHPAVATASGVDTITRARRRLIDRARSLCRRRDQPGRRLVGTSAMIKSRRTAPRSHRFEQSVSTRACTSRCV